MGGFVIIIGVILMVIIHEGGHFLAAKAFDMKATQAFFGFGPTLWSVQRGETEYGVKAFPLGGFVKIIGMNPFEEVEPEDEDRTYRVKPFWQKSVVVLAGIFSHFVVAFVLFAVIAAVWGTARLPEPVPSPVVDGVGRLTTPDPLLPAYEWDSEPGDVVVAFGGTPVTELPAFDFDTEAEPTLTVLRDGQELEVMAEPFAFFGDDRVLSIDATAPADIPLGTVLPDVFTLEVERTLSDETQIIPIVTSVVPQLWLGSDTPISINGVEWGDLVPFADDEPGDLTKVTVDRDGELIDFYTSQRVVPAPAFLAGIQDGDRILSVGDDTISSWDDFTEAARARPGETTTVVVERDGDELAFDVTLAVRVIVDDNGEQEVGFFGVSPDQRVGVLGSIPAAGRNLVFSTSAAAQGLWDLVTNFGNILTATFTNDDEVLTENRPISVIGLFQIAQGLDEGLVLLAFVNVFVGLLNVVPFYPLDGGHFAVALYEKIRGRSADVRKLLPVAVAVFVFVLLLGLLGIYLDIVNPIEIPGR